ncbi:MAG: class I SAM-dependent methyltransferase, partial [Bacteroidales bacterium]
NTRGSVLEAGSGTGRLFAEALKNGADIYGIDISPSMIGILKKKLSPDQQKRISLQSIVDFRLDKKFDLVIAPFRVFMHLTGKMDQLGALNNIWDHLNPGGKFIFDVFIPDLKLLLTGMDNVTDFDGEFGPGNRVKRTSSSKPEIVDQILNVTFRFDWNEKDKNYSAEWKTTMRYFFRFELEHLIERSKFGKYRIIGDFLGNDLTSDSKEFIVICQK